MLRQIMLEERATSSEMCLDRPQCRNRRARAGAVHSLCLEVLEVLPPPSSQRMTRVAAPEDAPGRGCRGDAPRGGGD